MKVSVIIPFYKVADFIERCAESLMQQTLEDAEFLFVDDASPDKSREILEKVLAKYPNRNARILTHEVNKGLPAARNTGLAEAKGEYIFHCDSDDYPALDMLEKMYNAGIKADADIVYCDFYMTFPSGERYMSNPTFTTAQDLLKDGFLSGTTKYNVWNKLIKRELYQKTKFGFPEGHSMGEDMTVILLAANADKVAHVAEPLYHYVKFNAKAFSNTFSQRHLEDIEFNVNRTLGYLEGKVEDKYLQFFKLNVKLPFLFSGDKAQVALWKQWYPESNAYVLENKVLPFRTRMVQWFAAHNMLWLVNLYVRAVNNAYKMRFGK